MSNRKTALTELLDLLKTETPNFFVDNMVFLHKLQVLEKEQIETAFDTGMNNSVDFYIPYASGDKRIPECENYYKQTFQKD